jgi:uncharacterized protein (TIGR00369 family)
VTPETDKNLAQQFIDAYHNGAFPFLHAIHMEPLEIGVGTGSLRIVLEEQHLRYGGIMHGGVATALLDTALGLAAATKAPPQHNVVTAQMNVNFIKAARAGEELIGSAEVMHFGRRTCVCRASIRTPDGELIASGSGTLLFVPMPLEDAELLLSLGQSATGR